MKLLSGFLLLIVLTMLPLRGDEGMYPLSEINKLNLKEKGFQIKPVELYNPQGVSLMDGIINLSGCTASFVSGNGLILTNYHCAFRGIQGATTKKDDYMKHGFIASAMGDEIPAKGYTVRITESYKDVSKQVLKVVKKGMTHAQRTKAIKKQIKKIVLKAEKKNPGKRANVSEMFIGRTYVLFISTYLKDIRLVYAPPRSVGEYGGEEDNWMWPRHTGDFTFMRAYVGKNGKPASYSKANVPYKPKRHLRVAAEGTKEGDFAFILGYPGRTYRHRSAAFLNYEENLRMPYVVELYGWWISVLEKMSEKDRTVAIKLAPSLKGLWNVMKNYKGKLEGLGKLGITEKRRSEERKLVEYINSKPELKERAGNLMSSIDEYYKNREDEFHYDQLMRYIFRGSSLLGGAFTAYEASIEIRKKDTDRKYAYMKRNFRRTSARVLRGLRNFYEPAEKVIFGNLLLRAAKLEGKKRISVVDDIVKKYGGEPEAAIKKFVDEIYSKTELKSPEKMKALFKMKRKELRKSTDPFVKLAIALYPVVKAKEESDNKNKGILDELMSELVNVRMKFSGKSFIPDANSTLRLTWGRIKGYSPKDAVYHKPFTTISGIVEKDTGKHPFNAPEKLKTLVKNRDYGRYSHPDLKDVPVAFLYDMDTTGGNSGSPVLNAKGELIGLNFDRVFFFFFTELQLTIMPGIKITVDLSVLI